MLHCGPAPLVPKIVLELKIDEFNLIILRLFMKFSNRKMLRMIDIF
jgi:hypothetical protein